LKLLTKKEFQSFKKMVRSPYFNSQDEMIRLIDFLETAYPKFKQFQSPDILCREVFQSNNGYGPKEKETLKRLFFKTNQLVNQFLVLENLNHKKQHLQQRMLMDELRSRNNYEGAASLLTKSYNAINSAEIQEISYLYNNFLFAEVDFFLQIYSSNRGKSRQMQELLNRFRQFAIGQGLYYYSAAINREQILQTDYEYPLLPSILKFLEQHPEDLKMPFIHAWYCVVKLLQQPATGQHFYTILDILQQHQSRFSSSGLRQLFGFVLNYCSNRVLLGDLSFLQHSFKLYDQALNEGFLFVDNKLSPHHYIRIVKKALEFEKIAWTITFIEQYATKLNSSYKKEVIALSNAMVCYSQNNFSEANQKLSTLGKTEDVFYELDYKILLLKIYYSFIVKQKDNSYEEALGNLTESLRIYLLPQRRKLMAEQIRKGYTNFLSCFKKLWKCNGQKGEKITQTVQKFQKEVNQTSPLFEKAWLLKQSNTLNPDNKNKPNQFPTPNP